MAKKQAKTNNPVSVAIPTSVRIGRGLIGVLQFAGPLLFFTSLTRNPYYTQITLLYVLASAIGLVWVIRLFRSSDEFGVRSGMERPLFLFLAVAFLTTAVSWWAHPTLRPGILFEGLRVWIFTLVNSVAAFYMPFWFMRPLSEDDRSESVWMDISFALAWSALWLGFHALKNTDPLELIWDPYGAIVWMVGLFYAYFRARKGRVMDVLHILFAVTVIAGLYGVFQYAGRDVIWSSPITPYGGRPVSTFGNPNFLSSYLLITTVLAAVLALSSKGAEAGGYGVVALIGTLAILSTLTRSTYVGLIFSFVVLLVLLKGTARAMLIKIAATGGLVILLIAVFPVTPVTGHQSPLSRFTEIYSALKGGESYGPWHQRVLIWSSAWEMIKERPLLGKGWGCFELFYPFYQGAFITNPLFAQWRTHANNAHNIVMEMWSQTGTVGLGVSFLLFGALAARGRKVVASLEGRSHALAAGLLAAWLGMVVDNFFGNVSIFFAMPAFLFWWVIGTLHQARFAESSVSVDRPALIRGVAMVLGLAFLFSGVYYFSRWRQEVWYFQGFKESKNNLITRSIASLEKAYAWFPGEVNSNYELGNSYARRAKELSDQGSVTEALHMRDKSIWAYSEALRANPGYDEIYFNRGVTLLQAGQKENGIKDLQTALLINPLQKTAYGPLSSLFVNDRRWAEARSALEQGTRAFPREVDFWNNLGYVYTQLGDDAKALEAIKKALELNPMHKTAWPNYLALIQKMKIKDPYEQLPGLMEKMTELINRKNFPEAKIAAQKLVDLIPANADVGLSYANILFFLNDYSGCVNEYRRVIQMAPEFETAHLNLGRIYQSRGQIQLAREQFTNVLGINRSNQDAAAALAQLPRK